MFRNLKAFGLALAMVFAMGAMAASAASAQQGKLTAEGPVTLDLTEIGGAGQNALTAFGNGLECPGTTYVGHRYNVTPHEPIPVPATTVTVTPSYNQASCVATPGPLPATVLMNGCDYVLHIGATTLVENQYGVTADIVCPVNKRIEMEVFFKDPGTRICTVIVKPQTGLAGATVTTDTIADDLEVAGTFKNVHVERTGVCGANQTTATGELHIKTTVKGTSEEGKSTGITVTD